MLEIKEVLALLLKQENFEQLNFSGFIVKFKNLIRRYPMKTVLILLLLFCVITLPALAELGVQDLEKIDAKIKEAEARIKEYTDASETRISRICECVRNADNRLCGCSRNADNRKYEDTDRERQNPDHVAHRVV